MQEELISVIIPTYNVEKYIGRCIESILKQTYTEFEMIIVDDGSDDKTIKICNEYRVRDNRIKIIQLDKHSGVAVARNTGLDEARGEYIAFVDADDYVVEDYFEVLYKNLKWADADISVCDFKCVDDSESNIFNNKKEKDNNLEIFKNDKKYYNIYNQYHVSTVVCWGKIFKKDIFKNLRYKLDSCHEDMFLVHYILKNTNTIVYTDKIGYFYVQRKGSTKSKFNVERLDFLDSEYDRIEFFRKNIKDENLYKCAVYSCCVNLMEHYCLLKKYVKNNKEYAKELYKKYRSLYSEVTKKSSEDELVYSMLNKNYLYSIMGKNLIYSVKNKNLIYKNIKWKLDIFYKHPQLYYFTNRQHIK